MHPTSQLKTQRRGFALPEPASCVRFTEEQLAGVIPSARYLGLRACFERLMIVVSAPATVPLILLLMLVIRIASPGPIFFLQERVGYRGVRFMMVKFRSMHAGADDGSPLTTVNDSRITRLGKFLREYHLDELPQLWNVFKGEMSLVGPRPEYVAVADMFERNIPLYGYRRVVPCGMTGWAQVNLGYAADIESTRVRLSYDLYYVSNLSLWLDLRILYRTIFTVLTRYGSR